MSSYRTLNRNDLGGFNEDAIECILAAMASGGTARISNRGHCIVRAPGGGTMSVSKDPSKANRGLQNQTADFRRLFGCDPTEALAKTKPEEQPKVTIEVSNGHLATRPTLKCTANDCDATFVTEGARYAHIQKDHVPCRFPGCMKACVSESTMEAHYRIVHEGVHPRKGTGGKRTRKPATKKAVSPRVPAQRKPSKSSDSETLLAIRALLGPDPRVAELEEALSKAEARIGELEAKIKLMKEALDL